MRIGACSLMHFVRGRCSEGIKSTKRKLKSIGAEVRIDHLREIIRIPRARRNAFPRTVNCAIINWEARCIDERMMYWMSTLTMSSKLVSCQESEMRGHCS